MPTLARNFFEVLDIEREIGYGDLMNKIWITLAWATAMLAAFWALSSPDAHADPYDPACGQQARCSYGPPSGPGLVYCPDTHGYVNQYSGACPSLWVGGYLPGGLVPNGGTDLAP